MIDFAPERPADEKCRDDRLWRGLVHHHGLKATRKELDMHKYLAILVATAFGMFTTNPVVAQTADTKPQRTIPSGAPTGIGMIDNSPRPFTPEQKAAADKRKADRQAAAEKTKADRLAADDTAKAATPPVVKKSTPMAKPKPEVDAAHE